jgi:hypothetical protein
MKADEETPQGACLDILERTTRRAVWPMVTSPAKKAGRRKPIDCNARDEPFDIKGQSSNRSVSVARIARIPLGFRLYERGNALIFAKL